MPPDELLPSCRLTPLGSWCDVVAAQNVAHGLIRNVMTQVGQRADNAVLPPTRVLAGKTNHQFLHHGGKPGSASIGTALGTIELAGNEPPVPGEDGVWFGHAGHLLQSFAPESPPDLSKRASLRIRQQPC